MISQSRTSERSWKRDARKVSWRGHAGGGLALFTLIVALGVVGFVEPASAQPPTTTMLVPSNSATVSGTRVVLDASASAGTTQVQFELNGGAVVIAAATPTIYGWIALWNSTTLPNGTYALQSVASANGVNGSSTATTIMVSNPAPSSLVVLPANGATVSGSPYLDATASSGVTQVLYEISGGPNNLVDLVISGSTPTYVGWVGIWNNTAGVPNGTYILNSVASYADGASGTSPPITITVSNPVTLADLTQSNISGTGTAALNVNGCSEDFVVDMTYLGGSSVAAIDLHIAGCINSESFSGSFTFSTQNAGTLSGSASGPIATITPCCQPPEIQFMMTLTVSAGTGPFAGTTGALQVVLTSPTSAPPTDIPFTGSVAAS